MSTETSPLNKKEQDHLVLDTSKDLHKNDLSLNAPHVAFASGVILVAITAVGAGLALHFGLIPFGGVGAMATEYGLYALGSAILIAGVTAVVLKVYAQRKTSYYSANIGNDVGDLRMTLMRHLLWGGHLSLNRLKAIDFEEVKKFVPNEEQEAFDKAVEENRGLLYLVENCHQTALEKFGEFSVDRVLNNPQSEREVLQDREAFKRSTLSNCVINQIKDLTENKLDAILKKLKKKLVPEDHLGKHLQVMDFLVGCLMGTENIEKKLELYRRQALDNQYQKAKKTDLIFLQEVRADEKQRIKDAFGKDYIIVFEGCAGANTAILAKKRIFKYVQGSHRASSDFGGGVLARFWNSQTDRFFDVASVHLQGFGLIQHKERNPKTKMEERASVAKRQLDWLRQSLADTADLLVGDWNTYQGHRNSNVDLVDYAEKQGYVGDYRHTNNATNFHQAYAPAWIDLMDGLSYKIDNALGLESRFEMKKGGVKVSSLVDRVQNGSDHCPISGLVVDKSFSLFQALNFWLLK